jgi:hypothetical protein
MSSFSALSRFRKRNGRYQLRDADLQGANLQNADLQNADLRGANLRDADLRGANLVIADLQGADLQGARLHGAYLTYANLQGVDLQGVDLQGVNLGGADLRGAHLQGVNLRGAYLRDAHLLNVDLQGVDLRGVNLRDAFLHVERANTEGAILPVERANTVRARQPLVNPFQVHQAFVPSLENFKELLPLLNGGDTDNFDSLFTGEGGCRFVDNIDDELIKMYVSGETDTSTLKRNLLPVITKLQASGYDLCEKVKPIGSTEVYDVTMKEFILASFRFAKRRTSGYKNRFIEFFTQDCLTAYEGSGSGAISCIGGILERFILVIPNAFLDDTEITSKDTKSNLNKIKNIILGIKILAEDVTAVTGSAKEDELRRIMGVCSLEIDTGAAAAPIEAYISCMKSKLKDTGSILTDEDVETYVNHYHPLLGGRKRKNRRNTTNKRNKRNKRNTKNKRNRR